MTRRISSSRPMTGSSLPCARLARQVAAVLLERLVGALRVLATSRAGRRGPAGSACRICSRLAPAVSRMRCASPPGLGRGRSRCSVETYSSLEALGLVLGTLEQPLRARVERQLAALDPGARGASTAASSPRTRAGSTPSARRVAAGMPSRILEQCGEEVFRVEDGLCAARRAAGRRRSPPAPSRCIGRASWCDPVRVLVMGASRWWWPAGRAGRQVQEVAWRLPRLVVRPVGRTTLDLARTGRRALPP